jgi:hypothetical protein
MDDSSAFVTLAGGMYGKARPMGTGARIGSEAEAESACYGVQSVQGEQSSRPLTELLEGRSIQ